MAYTASQLITQSWYLSGIVSQNFETVTGDKIEEGLYLLNALLAMKSVDLDFLNYYTVYDGLNLVQGQESYFIPNLVSVESFTFFIGPVRYATSPQSRKNYFATGRVNNIQSLPFNWHVEREKGGATLYVYFLPAGAYDAQITGQFSLSQVSLTTDLSATLDNFYIEFLRFELADYMCAQYNVQLQGSQAALLQRYRKVMARVSTPDMTITKLSAFNKNTGMSWADINFGQGWRPV